MRHQIHYKPIEHWPGEKPPRCSHSSPFRADWSTTENDLLDEVHHLGKLDWLGRPVENRSGLFVLVQVASHDIRSDDLGLKANARLQHHGVVVNFDTRFGEMQLWCDRFLNWRDNVRGIALALEAMRKIERYGVGTGREQYQGWLAIEQTSTSTVADLDEAFISDLLGWKLHDVRANRTMALREALLKAHPDRGGDHDAMVRVNEIRRRWAV